jgi:enediyne biosynthesis protein E4
MMKRRRWRRLVLVVVAMTLAWGLYDRFELWRVRREMVRAQAEIAAGRLEAARRRLAVLEAAHPGALGGTVDYLLGVCEATAGRDDAALAAFARVPEQFEFAPAGAYLEARANLECGRLRAAESRLETSLSRGGSDQDRLPPLLVRVYEMQARFDDVRDLLLARLKSAQEPLKLLKELDNVKQGRHPYDGLRAALEQAGRRAPEDERVWLGKGRLALAAGRWAEAADWLRRCLEARADAPVWRAWLDWAQGAGRSDEARRALEHLGSGGLNPAARLAARAWLAALRDDHRAERRVLEQWLRVDPAAPRALERLAELAHRHGETVFAAELRRRKAEVDHAVDHYRALLWRADRTVKSDDRLELARAAEAAGYGPEARALYAWLLKSAPDHRAAREALARHDRTAAERALAASALAEAWLDREEVWRGDQAERDADSLIVPSFTDDAEAVGLRFTYDNGSSIIHQLPEQSGGGVALLDYDGDGWLDVYCVQGGPFPPGGTAFQAVGDDHGQDARATPGDRLFRNRGESTFEDVTRSSGLTWLPQGYGHGVTVGDYDGDGDPDLFLTRWRAYALYRNNGDGTFSNVTEAAGLGGPRGWPTSAAFADLDGDGDLDLYVCHYVTWDPENPLLCRDPSSGAYITCNPVDSQAEADHLFRNDGGRFVDVTPKAGIIDRDGRGLGVVAADLDGDGRMDVFVANDMTANYLLRNLGGMRFEEVGHAAGVAGNASGGYQAGMGVAAGDLDGDGRIDLAVTNFFGESTTFFCNLGGGLFGDHTANVGLAAATRSLLGFGVAFLDANDDGRLDLVSANGHVNDLRPNYRYQMPAQLLVGGPRGRLTDVSDRAGAPWRVLRMGRGLAVGDLDNDGRQDVLILSHNQPLAYLRNRTVGGRSLTLRLEGQGLNRDAIGARVIVVAGGHRLVAWRTGGGSFQSASDPRLHFGLGDARRVESIEIAWPSGREDRYTDLGAHAGYLLREGESEPEPLKGFSSRDAHPRR